MTLSAAQRSAKNKENASKSTGPKSDAGKAKSRLNAVKHGLRAEVVALPFEDPEAVAARSDAWNDYYQPQSPAAQHLVNQCVQATLLSDRVNRYHAAALTKQMGDAREAWENDFGDQLLVCQELLMKDPLCALDGLKKSSRGARYLIGRWQAHSDALEARGHMDEYEAKEAVRMLGALNDPRSVRECPAAWALAFHALLCRPDVTHEEVFEFLRPNRLPDAYRGRFTGEALPTQAACRKRLLSMMAEQIESLRRLLPSLDAEPVDPERAAAVDRATILHDGPSARLFLRYHSEARTSFHRAYGELVKTLARDAEELAEDASPDAADGPSPNEANSTAESSESLTETTTSDPCPAPETVPVSSPEQIETSVTDAARPSEAVAGLKNGVSEAA